MRAASGLAACAALALHARASAAQVAVAHPPVTITLEACAGVDVAEVRRIAGVELRALLVERDQAGPDATRVDVRCGEGATVIAVDDPITGKSLQRRIAWRDGNATQPRLLALAVAELVSSSWTELESNPTPVLSLESAPSVSAPVRAAVLEVVRARAPVRPVLTLPVVRPRTLRTMLTFGARTFPSGLGAFGSVGARVADDPWRFLGWSADALVEESNVSTALGRVRINTVTLGATLSLQHRWSEVTARVGLGLRGGVARLEGSPRVPMRTTGSTLVAPWGGALASVGASYAAERGPVVEGVLEGGYTVLPVGGYVDGDRSVALEGPWFAAHVSVGFRP